MDAASVINPEAVLAIRLGRPNSCLVYPNEILPHVHHSCWPTQNLLGPLTGLPKWKFLEQPLDKSLLVTAQGSPLHLQIDTFEDGRLSTPVHRAYSQIKVFCDKVCCSIASVFLFIYGPSRNFDDNWIVFSNSWIILKLAIIFMKCGVVAQ